MRITLMDGALCTPDRARVVDFDPDQFLDLIASVGKVPSYEAATEDAKVRGLGFVLATWRTGSTTKADSALDPSSSTELLCFDVDAMTLDELREVMPGWQRVDAAVYSTWKHTSAAPRLRLVVRLDGPISVADTKVFRHCYVAAAKALGLRYDPRADKRANLYFFPQHKPGTNGAATRERWHGARLPVAGLLQMDVDLGDSGDAPEVAGATLERPDRGEVRSLAGKLKRRKSQHSRQVGLALAAVVRAERYAADGSVYGVTQHLAFALAMEVPDLDASWFREHWLTPCWEVMWPGQELAPAARDWGNAWDSAALKVRDALRERAREREAVAATAGAELTVDQVEKLAPFAGALIAVHGSGYYILDARAAEYSGAVKAAVVAPRARDMLGGVPGVFVTEPRENGRPVAKSPTQLVMDYGTVVDAVHYWARVPIGVASWESQTLAIHVRAYTWNDWESRKHAIVDDLLRSMAGDRYPALEAMLSKWRDLEQPLPALTMVGPPGTWKSRIAQTLSRFWGDRHAPTACRAEHVLRRFSAPLLVNPVVWTDERMATGEGGQPIPEDYRESISETSHQIERKGLDPITLHTATRHVISVNDVGKVFSTEVSGDAVRATLDRFLVLQVDGDVMAAFEKRWAGTVEMAELREGTPLLEHVVMLERDTHHQSTGRFFVAGHTDPDVLTRARFADDTLNLVLQVAVDALLAEARFSKPGVDPERTPLTGADPGVLRFSPGRLVKLWTEAPATKGWRGGTPAAARVGRVLAAAGFKQDPSEQAGKTKFRAWVLNKTTFSAWLSVSDLYAQDEVSKAIFTIWDSKMAFDNDQIEIR